MTPGRKKDSELDLGRLALARGGDLEERAGLEAESARHQVGRETLNGRVVGDDGVVVPLALAGDAVFRLRQLVLELHEVLVGPKLRISLRHGEKAAQGLREHPLRLGLLLDALGGDRLVAGGDDRLERLALVGGISANGLDEVWNEIVAALEEHLDVAPAGADTFLEVDKAVVGPHDPQANAEDHQQDDSDDDDNGPAHETSDAVAAANWPHQEHARTDSTPSPAATCTKSAVAWHDVKRRAAGLPAGSQVAKLLDLPSLEVVDQLGEPAGGHAIAVENDHGHPSGATGGDAGGGRIVLDFARLEADAVGAEACGPGRDHGADLRLATHLAPDALIDLGGDGANLVRIEAEGPGGLGTGSWRLNRLDGDRHAPFEQEHARVGIKAEPLAPLD